MEFQQAAIPVQNDAEYQALRDAVDRVFSAQRLDTFLSGLKRFGVKIREFERVLEKQLIERADPQLLTSGRTARQLYEAMALSDKAQMREFYLVRLEKVGDEVRERFSTVYREY